MSRFSLIIILLFCSRPFLFGAEDLPFRFFRDSSNKALFKVNASLQDYRLSGILIAKRIAPGEIRAVMTMETGLKVFDLSITDRRIRLHNAMKMYRNLFLKNVLYRDIRLLLSLPGLCREIRQKDGDTHTREGARKYLYTGSKNPLHYRKIRTKGKKHCEAALVETDREGVLLKSVHDFGGFPYRAEYQRLENY